MNTGKKFAYGLLALVVIAAVKTCHDTNSGSSSSSSNNNSSAPVVLSDADRAAIEAQAHADAVAASPTMTPEAVKAAAKRAADAKAAAEAAKSRAADVAKAEAETAATAATNAAAARLTAKIQDYALDKYTKDEFPKLFKALGKQGVKEAERGAKAAALKAALSEDCKSVENASVTMQSTKKHMEFFVNCEIDPVEGSPLEMKQWRFATSELKDKHGKWYTAETVTGAEAPGESDTDKNMKAQEAERNQAPADYSRCEEAIKAQLDYPSSADFHYLAGRADFVNPQNENVIRIDFEAKNGFGNMLPFVANCIFKHNGKVIADIYKR